MQCQQSLNWIVSLAVNLSIADTMVSSLNVTFNYVYMLNGHWPFGNIYCKVCSFISIISVCGSVFTLVAISTDRYDQFSLASSDASSEQIEYKGDWKFPYRIHGKEADRRGYWRIDLIRQITICSTAERKLNFPRGLESFLAFKKEPKNRVNSCCKSSHLKIAEGREANCKWRQNKKFETFQTIGASKG